MGNWAESRPYLCTPANISLIAANTGHRERQDHSGCISLVIRQCQMLRSFTNEVTWRYLLCLRLGNILSLISFHFHWFDKVNFSIDMVPFFTPRAFIPLLSFTNRHQSLPAVSYERGRAGWILKSRIETTTLLAWKTIMSDAVEPSPKRAIVERASPTAVPAKSLYTTRLRAL